MVTIVVTVLVIFAFMTKAVKPLIPPARPNKLVGESADYLVQGAAQAINWRVMDDQAFADARRLDKPVFIVVGSPWSKFARDMDRDSFSYGEVQNYLNRNFICIRVDSSEQPDWINTYLPVSRIKLGFRPGFQVWILDTQGRLFDFIGKSADTESLDHEVMLGLLIKARQTFDRLRNQETVESELASTQKMDQEMIEGGREDSPDFRGHMSMLGNESDPVFGGFPLLGRYQYPRPNSWRFQLITGHAGQFEKSITPLLHSSLVDVIDGGFFRIAETRNWHSVNFDKVAVANAELMKTLALAGELDGNHLGSYLAKRTFDSLTSEFILNGLVASCRVGDEGPLDRSSRSSFSPRRLRQILPDDALRNWAFSNLGLTDSENPQMVPRYAPQNAPFDELEKFESVIEKLRDSSNGSQPKFAGEGLLDVNGFVIARLIECARIWKDPVRLQSALTLYDKLENFRTNDDVVHSLSGTGRGRGYLTDYLSYADASLQAYLATGRTADFENGAAVLIRARFLYNGNAPGEFLLSQGSSSPLAPKETDSAEIVDNVCESCTARIIRLCHSYGRLMLGTTPENRVRHDSGLSLLQSAYAGVARFSGIANAAGCQTSGFFCASAEVQDSDYLLTVGPRAQELADDLSQLLPTRLAAPAFGSVRRDVQQKPSGVYVVDKKGVHGPFSVDEVVQKLGATLRVGN